MRTLAALAYRIVVVTVLGLAAVAPARAGEREDLLQIRNTVLNLVDALVKQGVLKKDQADALVRKAEEDAIAQARTPAAAAATAAKPVDSTPADQAALAPEAKALAATAANPKVVRVPYVPEFVKDQIRDQVRSELRGEVLADVEKKAKQEKWGLPEALPAWVNNIKWYGDFRLRDELDTYGSGNLPTLNGSYLNILNVNSAGGISQAGANAFLNTSEDKNFFRARLRVGMEAKLADNVKFDMRVTTGSQRNPVSTNQTLGNTAQGYSVQLDRAYLQYDRPTGDGYPWLTAALGRIPNPWYSTSLVWDRDLNFEGAAFTFRHGLGEGGAHGRGSYPARMGFATFGVFPLQSVDFSSKDKWLAGGQVGFNWGFSNQSEFKLGVAYYDYIHVTGRENSPCSLAINNGTAPQFVQKGNLLFNIANNPGCATPPPTALTSALFALASDYKLLNVTASVDFAQLEPYHVTLTGDVVKNLGFDANEIQQRTASTNLLYPFAVNGSQLKDRTLGYQLELVAGWPEIAKWGDWQLSATYKYLQRDAVLDAFTDSDFHLGGTDAQGYILGAKYGLTKNTWLAARWLSATEIDGPPLAIDVLQLDLNAKF